MNDNALKAAIRRLLDDGEDAKDNALMKMAAAKKAPPPVEAAQCEDCKVPMVDGKCPKCGKESEGPAEGEGDLAELLEAGSAE